VAALDDEAQFEDFAPDADAGAGGEQAPPLITEVPQAVRPPNSQRKTARRFPPVPPRDEVSEYSSEDLRRLFETMMTTRRCPKLTAISALRLWIARELQVAVEQCRYEYGEELRDGDEMLVGFMSSDERHVERDKRRQDAVDRCVQVREQLGEAARELEDRIVHWRGSQEQRLVELREVQRREVEDFEHEWQDLKLLQYNKASPRLIALRKTERRMAIFKQFEGARRVKAEADALEREELAEAQRRAVAAIRIGYQNLMVKQKREMDCLLQYTQRSVDSFEKTRDAHIRRMEQMVGRMTLESSQQKPPERKKEWRGDAAFPQVSRPVRILDIATSWNPARGLGLPAIQVRQYIKVPKTAGQTKKKPAKRDAAETE
jgi:hypothetical protein